ncbi:hypothetical protein [Staphylococcus haemolyticus]|uniref:hypothetical protein n=1 Tax=Staphylococcus haemolyticus TaxID=1283 RepID=UPI001F0AE490|nr:hypothetical protein [Staphylococcus haemolyticus]MCH4336735.1 hypothetical protein [Staphylococcus haemolyticus]
MIEAKLSNINDTEDWFPSIKQIARCLNALKNQNKKVYINALDLINGVINIFSNVSKKEYEVYQEVELAINSQIDTFKLFSDENSNTVIKYYINTIERSIKILTSKCETLTEKEVNKIRGLLTEAVACSFLGDVSKPNIRNFIWDCCFYKDNNLLYIENENGGKVFSTDIYYNNAVVNLCECKTRPYFKTSQFEFMEYIKEEYEKEKNSVQLYVFVLNFQRNPMVETELNKLTDNFELKTLDDIKAVV